MKTLWTGLVVVAVLAWTFGEARAAVRIKDITELEGARANQLYGLGLVVGLNGTGGKSTFTRRVAVDLFQKLNVTARTASQVQAESVYIGGNSAVVMVTAEIGPFARKGSKIDVIVSVADDATSLQGGTLLPTPLRGFDGEAYAVAAGPVSIGGFSISGAAATAVKNHPTVGRVPGGAFVEREARGTILCHGQIHLLLREPDYVTARAIARAVNEKFPKAAETLDAGTVEVTVPANRLDDLVGFVGDIGLMEVVPDAPARVVINERTGTVVAGENVKVSTTGITHGNLGIVRTEDAAVAQPAPLSPGVTTVVPQTNLAVTEQTGQMRVVERAVTVAELAKALNALGVSPRDLIAIFQALKQAGALHAELVIM
jgi:flagellar P-ring protein precursor FlgI